MIFFWLPIAAGAVVGKLSGGRLTSLTSLHLKHVWILLLAVAVQTVLVMSPPVPSERGIDPLRVLLPATTVAIGLFVAVNRALPGMWLVLAGLASNLLVITANGGLMPASPEALTRAERVESIEVGRSQLGERLPRSKDVVLEENETNLLWLADAIVSPPLPKRKVMSVGDLAIAAGLAYLTFRTMRASRAALAEHAAHDLQTQISSKEHQRGAALPIPSWANVGLDARPHPERAMA